MQLSELPKDILWLVFDHCTLGDKLHLTSKGLWSNRASQKINKFFEIQKYLSLTLSSSERSLPLQDQLYRIRQLVNTPDQIGKTPLIKATLSAKFKPDAKASIPILIELGADPEQKFNGRTAADFAQFWNIQT